MRKPFNAAPWVVLACALALLALMFLGSCKSLGWWDEPIDGPPPVQVPTEPAQPIVIEGPDGSQIVIQPPAPQPPETHGDVVVGTGAHLLAWALGVPAAGGLIAGVLGSLNRGRRKPPAPQPE